LASCSPQDNGLKALLKMVADGKISPEDAEAQIQHQQIEEMGFATIDLQRESRRGRPEVIYCGHKTTEQVVMIAQRMAEAGQNVMMTRMTDDQQEAIKVAFAGKELVHEPLARLMCVIQKPVVMKGGLVGVLAAGTSDLPVAEEAAITAELLGSPVERAYDVGVAGLHRLLRQAKLLTQARVLIVVAGMEGALPSVVSGLVSAPVIGVPTDVGYGANLAGLAPLLTMINGCSPGVAVVNINNGFGAGYLADLINSLGSQKED
jgi:pyridinium-3,5-biscarboxylic acid mononucleotide synthase